MSKPRPCRGSRRIYTPESVFNRFLAALVSRRLGRALPPPACPCPHICAISGLNFSRTQPWISNLFSPSQGKRRSRQAWWPVQALAVGAERAVIGNHGDAEASRRHRAVPAQTEGSRRAF